MEALPTQGTTMDLLHLVDRLEEIVAEAQKVPIGNRVIIDKRRLLDLVDQMRVAVPQEVRDAKELVSDRERVRRETEEESRLMIASTEEEAARLVDEHNLTEAARERAREIVAEAEASLEDRMRQSSADIQQRIDDSSQIAKQQMQAADDYARELLIRLERQLQAFIGSVQAGVEQLEPEREVPPMKSDIAAPASRSVDSEDDYVSSSDADGRINEKSDSEGLNLIDSVDDRVVGDGDGSLLIDEPSISEERQVDKSSFDAITPEVAGADQKVKSETAEEELVQKTVELEDLLGRAREAAEEAALAAVVESELAIDDAKVIDDFANPPLDDDPLNDTDDTKQESKNR